MHIAEFHIYKIFTVNIAHSVIGVADPHNAQPLHAYM